MLQNLHPLAANVTEFAGLAASAIASFAIRVAPVVLALQVIHDLARGVLTRYLTRAIGSRRCVHRCGRHICPWRDADLEPRPDAMAAAARANANSATLSRALATPDVDRGLFASARLCVLVWRDNRFHRLLPVSRF